MNESAADMTLTLAARADEAEVQVEALRTRCVVLNMEVRHRDERIAELEAALAEREDS